MIAHHLVEIRNKSLNAYRQFKNITQTEKTAYFFACTSLILTSCFKDEPLNAECDIWQAYVSLPDPTTMFFSAADTIAKLSSAENVVVFSPRASADLTAVALNFVITDGATIEPANGSVQDFSQGPVEYIVTSQDGAWSRIYSVKFNRTERTFTDTVKFDFEHTYLGSNSSGSTFFYYWTDLSTNGDTLYNWATGNAGFAISQSKADKMAYPSVPIEDGFDGRAVRLTTSATGALASMMSMPIAAGNLFIGKFLSDERTLKVLSAVHIIGRFPVSDKKQRMEKSRKYCVKEPSVFCSVLQISILTGII